MPHLKIVILTGIFPPDIGGPATYVPRMSQFLIEQGHDVTVVTLSDTIEFVERSIYPFRLIRTKRKSFIPIRTIKIIVRIIKEAWNADILFVNGLQFEAFFANMFLRKPTVLKVVGDTAWERAVGRGWVSDTFEEFQKKKYSRKVEFIRMLRAWWSRSADNVIVPSNYLANHVHYWGVKSNKIHVIYNSVDVSIHPVPTNAQMKQPVKILTVARLMPWKHIDMIIKSIISLNEAGLIVVGDGPELENLKSLAIKYQIEDRVFFAGARDKAEVFSLMKTCDIFVLNSTYEGLPHVIIEAMHAGMAVVATRVGGTSEVIDDGYNGRLIQPLNEEELYTALYELVKCTEERKRLGENARSSLERFQARHMLEESTSIIEKTSKRFDAISDSL